MKPSHAVPALAALFAALPEGARAAAAGLDGAALGLAWGLPFIGILASIALGPLLAHHLWERHQGKIALAWAALVLIPLAMVHGPAATSAALLHTALLEYLPFVLLLFALFTTAGGIIITGLPRGSPALNTLVLALGGVLASLIGTTGASMVLIRPLVRANEDRRYQVHVVVFFIFIVSNIGGALTPLGDPPLFLGFLKGVDFFWTTRHLIAPTLVATAALLGAFAVIDFWLTRRENRHARAPDPEPGERLKCRGLINLPLIGLIVAAILVSGTWQPGTVSLLGIGVPIENLIRDGVLVVAGVLSLLITPAEHRAENGFSWGSMQEVAKLFAGIFACIIPVVAMLRAGSRGALAPLVALVSGPDGSPDNSAYFWLTGGLSAVLDNAPTYLVFFELAGGDPVELMGRLAPTLAAISMGAVFMGALTYIGNAPNFMVYAIARQRGVAMPNFFGYLVWSGLVLLPLFALIAALFVH